MSLLYLKYCSERLVVSTSLHQIMLQNLFQIKKSRTDINEGLKYHNHIFKN